MHDREDRGGWFFADKERCDRADPHPVRPLRMVLLGAPGVGKGTQAEMLCERFGACQLSTGDIFRAAKEAAPDRLSPAMTQALECMRTGQLVPDEIVVALVGERSHCLDCGYGFLLDGFPRTVQQAEVLEQILAQRGIQLDLVLNYELPIEEIVERLSGRRTCHDCSTTFHLGTKPPVVPGICDKCGGELYQREDDQPEAIRVRLEAYEESTAPLTGYYTEKGLLCTVPAEGEPHLVFARTESVLDDFLACA